MSRLVLHGVPFSQPFRSVAWICALKGIPFSVQVCVPGMKGKMGNLREEFQTPSNPLQTIPLLEEQNEDGTSLYQLSESSAILKYICTKHDLKDLFPVQDLQLTAQMDAYFLGPHREVFRPISTSIVGPLVRPDISFNVSEDECSKIISKAGNLLEHFYLVENDGQDTKFMFNRKEPSITDFQAYAELGQVFFHDLHSFDEEDYPKLHKWADAMSNVKYHDDVHIVNKGLGKLIPNDKTTFKRMGELTKQQLKKFKTDFM